MCYPKPGPRCSSHARTRLARAQHAVLLAYRNMRDDETTEQAWEQALKARDDATREYGLTPAGMAMIQQEINLSTDPTHIASLEEQLRLLREQRQMMIDATNGEELRHELATPPEIGDALPASLSASGAVLHSQEVEAPAVQASLEESILWARKLTDEETAAMRWYSQAGYADINSYLARGVPEQANPEQMPEMVSLLDSALAKQPAGVEKVVYRRHFFYNEDQSDSMFANLSLEEQQNMFQPGSIFQHSGYLSTSLDPGNHPGSDGGITAFLQIKTTSAVSIAATHQQGTNEQEYLIPRDAKFRVVANDTKVTVVDKRGKAVELTVFQLEEVSE